VRTPLVPSVERQLSLGHARWPKALALAAAATAVAWGLAWPVGSPPQAAAAAATPAPTAPDDPARQAEIARQHRLQEALVLAEQGRKLLAARAYAEARDALRQALRLNPADAASRKLLEEAEAALGIPSASGVLAHTRERHTFKAQVLRQQIELDLFEAERALKANDPQRAAQQAERALAAVGQLDDAAASTELRGRAEAILAEARSASAADAASRRQTQLERAKAQAASERTERARETADGLRALRDQGWRYIEAKDYDKALSIADQMERAAPGNRDALALRERVSQATLSTMGLRGKSRERREGEEGLMRDIELELTPPKPNVVVEADPKRAKTRPLASPAERWEYDIRAKLAKDVTIEFRETPVAQALDQLASVGDVNIILDPEAGAAQGTVTIARCSMPLGSLLNWVGQFGNLRYCLRDGAIFFTSRTGALDAPVTKMYDISTLLSPPTTAEPMRTAGPVEPGPGPAQVVEATQPDPEPIGNGWVDFIRSSIAPGTWERPATLQQQTPYTIAYRNGRIVVVHTPEVQRQVEQLLNDFRKARSLQVHMLGRFITIERTFLDSLNFSFQYGSGTRFTEDTVGANLAPSTQLTPLAEFNNYSIGGGLNMRYSLLDDDSLVMLLRAVVHEGKGTVLEAPRLTCYNTQRANIQVLRNRNYVRRVSSDFTPEIGNIPEGTIFDIQPFVSADRRYITLVCQPQMRTFVSFTDFIYGVQVVQLTDDTSAIVPMRIQLPTTQLRSVGTTVTVPNGGTVIMGGFTNVQEQAGLATVPFIEGIPVLRTILRGRDRIEGRRSLIMLITAETVEDIFEEE